MNDRPAVRASRRATAARFLIAVGGLAQCASQAEAAPTDIAQRTRDEARRFMSITQARTAGYQRGSLVRGIEHWFAPGREVRTSALDPRHPSGLMYRVEPNGEHTLLAAMFMMADTQATPPSIAGLHWHDHVICRGAAGLGQVNADGSCPNGTSPQHTPPMAHVFLDGESAVGNGDGV